MSDPSYIDRNVERISVLVKEKQTKPVRMICAVKYATDEEYLHLLSLPQITDVGENRVQQLLHHWEIDGGNPVRRHFIGTLQTNKVKYIVDKVVCIQSVNSIILATEIEKQCAKKEIVMDVMAEVNATGEESKTGADASDIPALVDFILTCPHLRLVGFMTMGPKNATEKEYFEIFSEIYHLGLDIFSKIEYNIKKCIFSMGMSGSFLPAISAGTDEIRIGRALFEKENL